MFQRTLIGAFCAAFLTTFAWAESPSLRIAVLKFGTVNWELNTIKHHALDTSNGFFLEVQGMAGSAAAKVAFQGGNTDVIVSDWLWVARQRAAGKDYVFLPYSTAVGGVMVAQKSPIKTLGDLKGGKIGIAGGPLDKNWLILRAYAEKKFDFDLEAATEQVFAAPPLIFKSALSGDIDAAINFWHFSAKMQASGMRKLVDVSDAARELGLDPNTPLLGYVIKGEMLGADPELAHGLAKASRQAKEILATDDAEWDRLRAYMNAKTDRQFEALKAGFRAGIPTGEPVDEAAAGRMLKLMLQYGGQALLGKARELPKGTFLQSGR